MGDPSAPHWRPSVIMEAKPSLPASRLELGMGELKPAFNRSQALAEANRCLFCHDAPCVTACPTAIDIPGFIRKIATGNTRGAAKTILEANILGHSCARVCPVEVLCVGSCVYNLESKPPIQIGRLQRYATDDTMARGLRHFEVAPPTGCKIALIGGGPASLACAAELLATANTHEFVRFLTGAQSRAEHALPMVTPPPSPSPQPKAGRKVACLAHFMEPEDLLEFDPTLGSLTAEQCTHLLAQTQSVFEPFVVGEQTICGSQGEAIQLVLIGIPYTSAQIADRQRRNALAPVLAAIEQGVEIAKELGCSLVGMTGYTSIVA